jgi:phospholipid/cholesterol/gamma-HCH transport system substrate-binding protein
MKQGVRDVIIGLVAIVALAGVVLLLFWFGELEALLHPRYQLTILTNHARGLRAGSSVELNGVPIGQVSLVSIGPDIKQPVRIDLMIDESVRIPTTAVAYAETSLLGASAILVLGTPAVPTTPMEFHPVDGTAVIRQPLRIQLIEEITNELDARMAPIIAAFEKIDELSSTYMQFGENLNDLVAPPDPNLPPGQQPENIRDTIAKFNDMLDKMREATDLANAWLEDPQIMADARKAVDNATVLIEKATATFERYTVLADEISADSDALVKTLIPVSDDMSALLADLRVLTKRADEGRGTVGQLLNNPDLYNALTDAAQRLEATLAHLEALIEKLRNEGVDVNL